MESGQVRTFGNNRIRHGRVNSELFKPENSGFSAVGVVNGIAVTGSGNAGNISLLQQGNQGKAKGKLAHNQHSQWTQCLNFIFVLQGQFINFRGRSVGTYDWEVYVVNAVVQVYGQLFFFIAPMNRGMIC